MCVVDDARALLAAGDAAGAVPLLERALTGDSRLSVAHDLARAYLAVGRLDDGVQLMRRIAVAAPHRLAVHHQLVDVLRSVGRDQTALAACRAGLAHHPDDLTLLVAMGALAADLHAWPEALAAEQRLGELLPDDIAVCQRAATAARRIGDQAAVVAAVTRWHNLAPNDPSVRHLHAASTGGHLERADPAYIVALFDAYAHRFDEHLAALGYCAPASIAQRLAGLLPVGTDTVADLGCGTGLVGQALNGLARHLIGVDLSPGMLAEARARRCYDRLVCGELTAFLRDHPGQFDAIVSADTLIYLGDLRPVFAAAQAALRGAGVLVFTLEHLAEAPNPGYRLEQTGRFSHSREWVAAQLRAAGFGGVEVEERVVRRERNDDVRGLLVTARREVVSEAPHRRRSISGVHPMRRHRQTDDTHVTTTTEPTRSTRS